MFVAGQWNVLCQRCGKKFKAEQLRLESTNLRVCSGPGTSGCWEPKQPQMSVTGRADKQMPPWTRPGSDAVPIITNDWDDF